jgi:hypothetical protein
VLSDPQQRQQYNQQRTRQVNGSPGSNSLQERPCMAWSTHMLAVRLSAGRHCQSCVAHTVQGMFCLHAQLPCY